MAETVVRLPTLHADQVRAYWAFRRYPRFVFRAGRRYGKTKFLEAIAADTAIKGGKVGWFIPEVKYGTEPFLNLKEALAPVLDTSNRNEGALRLKINRGRIKFWPLKDGITGRGDDNDLSIFDEHAFNKPDVKDIWERGVRPTLFDRSGRAIFASNTRGKDPDNHFYQLHEKVEAGEEGWGEFHAPTSANPLLPQRQPDETEESHARRRLEAIEELRRENAPLVFEQEFLANFVDWSGAAFFDLQKLLVDGLPVPYPEHCDAVFATIDTATKTGQSNDGTAVCYWAMNRPGIGMHRLVLLDWDLQQIEGSLLETWLPTVFENLAGYAVACRARGGSAGAWIEDRSSGMVLLQTALRREWPAHAIDSKLTMMGKSERAISVSGHVHQGHVKLSTVAHDKTVNYKGDTRNHFMSQFLGFRVGDEDRNRADDLLDAGTYGITVGLANDAGWG